VPDALLLPGFGSVVTLLATEAVSAIAVPDATVELTFTTKVKLAGVLVASVPMVQV
jgi:hypothetical protein